MLFVWGERLLRTIWISLNLRIYQVSRINDNDDNHKFKGMDEICEKKIEPGSMITVPYRVEQDCDLRWKFKTDGGDLGFGVQRKESETDSSPAFVDVLTPARVLRKCYLFAES